MIDGIDFTILTILLEDGRASNAEIARQVGMAPSAILERIRKLEQKGVITGYTVKVDPQVLDLALLSYIRIRAEEAVDSMEVGEALSQFPEVQEVHYTAGEDGYLIKVRTKNAEELGKFLRDRIGTIKHISSTMSTIVLTTVKETSALPIKTPIKGDGHAEPIQ